MNRKTVSPTNPLTKAVAIVANPKITTHAMSAVRREPHADAGFPRIRHGNRLETLFPQMFVAANVQREEIPDLQQRVVHGQLVWVEA